MTTDDMLIRDAEWWSDMDALGTLTDAELLARARTLVPELRRRLEDRAASLERFRTHHVLDGGIEP